MARLVPPGGMLTPGSLDSRVCENAEEVVVWDTRFARIISCRQRDRSSCDEAFLVFSLTVNQNALLRAFRTADRTSTSIILVRVLRVLYYPELSRDSPWIPIINSYGTVQKIDLFWVLVPYGTVRYLVLGDGVASVHILE